MNLSVQGSMHVNSADLPAAPGRVSPVQVESRGSVRSSARGRGVFCQLGEF